MQTSTAIILLSLLSFAYPQNAQVADGPIVPFTSVLPVCASSCGNLYNVQGKCSPPNIAAIDLTCFCTDTRLTSLNDGPSGVTAACADPGSCTTQSDLSAVQSWYVNLCKDNKVSTTTGAGGTTSTSTSTPKAGGGSGGGGGNSWYVLSSARPQGC